jgi:hypothetical protein
MDAKIAREKESEMNVHEETNKLDSLLRKTTTVKSRQDPGWKELSDEMFNLAHAISIEVRRISERLKMEGPELRPSVSQVIREVESGHIDEVRRRVGDALKATANIRKLM